MELKIGGGREDYDASPILYLKEKCRNLTGINGLRDKKWIKRLAVRRSLPKKGGRANARQRNSKAGKMGM